MIAIVASLLGTKIGRWGAGVLIGVVIVGTVLWTVFRKGKTSAEMQRKVEQLDALREKVKIDEEIRNMSAADRRKQLNKWVRN